mmetsp:Transcript_34437/g.67335  ORF Transcript_34437/g.67335 Transcript_34437/m.67335 type:complete len:551 (-) Transcript_34437:155-1807(-)
MALLGRFAAARLVRVVKGSLLAPAAADTLRRQCTTSADRHARRLPLGSAWSGVVAGRGRVGAMPSVLLGSSAVSAVRSLGTTPQGAPTTHADPDDHPLPGGGGIDTSNLTEAEQAALADAEVGLQERAEKLDVRLTADELTLFAIQAGGAERGLRITRHQLGKYSRDKASLDYEREAFLAAIEEPANEQSTLGQWILPVIGWIGTASYAIAGTQVAGEAGMNIIGCCFVGCISALGGGAVNALLFGYARNGVPWVKDPRSLFVALVSCLLTFFLWPMLCHELALERLRSIQETAKEHSWWSAVASRVGLAPDATESITRADFIAACEDEKFYLRMKKILSNLVHANLPGVTKPTPAQLFKLVDLNDNGTLDIPELERLVLLEYHGSAVRYSVDTVALGASSVAGSAAAISRGLHPLVCCVSGVTVCFGGILRDLICGRDVAVCTQSFAASTAAGATVYVVLREICLRGVSLPLSVRVLVSAGSAVMVRVADFWVEDGLLPPMYGRAKPIEEADVLPLRPVAAAGGEGGGLRSEASVGKGMEAHHLHTNVG